MNETIGPPRETRSSAPACAHYGFPRALSQAFANLACHWLCQCGVQTATALPTGRGIGRNTGTASSTHLREQIGPLSFAITSRAAKDRPWIDARRNHHQPFPAAKLEPIAGRHSIRLPPGGIDPRPRVLHRRQGFGSLCGVGLFEPAPFDCGLMRAFVTTTTRRTRRRQINLFHFLERRVRGVVVVVCRVERKPSSDHAGAKSVTWMILASVARLRQLF